jgi:hypothetical protein
MEIIVILCLLVWLEAGVVYPKHPHHQTLLEEPTQVMAGVMAGLAGQAVGV